MLTVEIPGWKTLELENLVLDYNGTAAVDGSLLPGTTERINQLSKIMQVHILTADTYGAAKKACKGLNVEFTALTAEIGAPEKEQFINKLRPAKTAAIGNGVNDSLMVKRAALGIAVIEQEGAAVLTLLSADIAVQGINCALDLLLHPQRLKATLRR